MLPPLLPPTDLTLSPHLSRIHRPCCRRYEQGKELPIAPPESRPCWHESKAYCCPLLGPASQPSLLATGPVTFIGSYPRFNLFIKVRFSTDLLSKARTDHHSTVLISPLNLTVACCSNAKHVGLKNLLDDYFNWISFTQAEACPTTSTRRSYIDKYHLDDLRSETEALHYVAHVF